MSLTEVYTDGSCVHQREETVGAWVALIFIDGDKITLKEIVKNTNHNRMELTAVIKAIEYLNNKNIFQITIHSDSNYVVNLKFRKEKLKTQNYFSKKGEPVQNADLVKALINLIDANQIEFSKVEAHQKRNSELTNYNREADKLVRKSLREFIKRTSTL